MMDYFFEAKLLTAMLAAFCILGNTHAFISRSTQYKGFNSSIQSSNGGNFDGSSGGMEEIEFRIYPDGRVTEIVRGVKGVNCEKVTEAINKQLGNVVYSKPTEERFEQELVVDQTVEQKIGSDGGWDGTSTW